MRLVVSRTTKSLAEPPLPPSHTSTLSTHYYTYSPLQSNYTCPGFAGKLIEFLNAEAVVPELAFSSFTAMNH